ncbi:DUF29 domain-containing protein [Devosia sp.]|uniref:DUF29 domain-containing protein n=1 Tax=Devosia sp. TaxID=1871048 RepID=UPI001AC63F8F|nr:DUF29 domain-containing protein [Devosia sp.]MBN9309805.1 DUF29 domain-containing protein [Devosia sp.]
MNKIDLKKLADYEEDFALWSAEQAALIRAGKFDRVDLENIAEEIESLGSNEKQEIESRLEVLIAHLLKWERQPEHRSRSWSSTIDEQRYRIARRIKHSPSLRTYPGEVFSELYPQARKTASAETTIYLHLFPETCPFTIEQILDPDFLPGGL